MSEINLSDLRELYANAEENATSKRRFLEAIKQSPEATMPSSTWLAYQACGEAIRAKDAFFPFEKLAHIHKAQRLFRQAIRQAPDNVEARFLRFSIQINTPRFLGLSNELSQDLHQILALLADSPIAQNMKRGIAGFVLNSGQCSIEQKAILQSLLAD